MTNEETIITTFNGTKYYKPNEAQEAKGIDYTAVFTEIIPIGETFETWTTMITLHQLQPLPNGSKISAEAYSNNILTMNNQKGAQILETSVLSNPEWEQFGIDISNPPFLLAYVHSMPQTNQAELTIAKINNVTDEKVEGIFFGKKLPASEVNTFIQSEDYKNIRIELAKKETF